MFSDSDETYTENDSASVYDNWITNYLNEYPKLIAIPSFFIEDKFNFVGLSGMVDHIERSFDVILDIKDSKYRTDEVTLYHLMHQRYIHTAMGMDKIYVMIKEKSAFGKCCKLECEYSPLIPTGQSGHPHVGNVLLYCYSCNTLYQPTDELKELDGCAFGPTFPHLLILNKPGGFIRKKDTTYIPRIYGFKVEEPEIGEE